MGVLQRFERRIEEMVNRPFARAFKAEVQPVEIASALQRECDDRAAIVARGIEAVGLESAPPHVSCGADDFAYYARSAPALMLFVGTGGPVSLHHSRFLPDESAVGQVAAVMLAGYLGALALIAAGSATTR